MAAAAVNAPQVLAASPEYYAASGVFGDFVPETAGRPLGEVEIRILDTSQPRCDRPLPVGSEGHVAVASPSMLSGYVDG